MTDYNSGLLPEPCLRLDYGGSDIASIELGDGTCYIKADGVVKNLLQMPMRSCKGYKKRKSHDGWHFHGYRSMYDDKRKWTA